MKKIFILLSILFVGKISAQVFSETFGSSATSTGVPVNGTWDLSVNGDFSFQNPATTIPGYTACTIPSSSGSWFLAGEDFSGGPEEAKVSFSTAGWAAMTLSWNGLRMPGAPLLSVEMSTDDITYVPLSFTDVASDGAWHALSPITIPNTFENIGTVYLKFTYTSGGLNNIIAFDDISISGTGSPTYYWDGSGQLQSTASWWSNIGGTGSHPGSFTSTGQSFIMGPGGFTSATLSAPWTVSGTGSKVVLNDGTNPFNLTLSTSATLSLLAGAKLNVLNNSTLTLQNTTGLPSVTSLSLGTGSTINFAQSSAVNLLNVTYHNLVISGGADKNQVGLDITVNGNLNIASGSNLSMNTNPAKSLTLNGTISGSGTLKTNTGSNLIINGSGAFGTLNFSAGTATLLTNLTINRASSGTGIVLGTNLTVSNTAVFSDGLVNINGKSLTLNGATAIGSGTFGGSKTSSLTLNGSVSGSLMMNQASSTTKALGNLTLNNSSGLTLGNAIEIWGAITPSVGTITTGGNLTIKQDPSNKGRIGTISTGGFSGNVAAEYYAPGPTTGWALLGANGISGKTMNDWYGQFPMAIEGSTTDVTSAGGYFESVQGWNEADAYGYDTTITVSTPLAQGQGFWVYLGDGQTTTSDFTLKLTGSAITGNVTIPLTNSAQSGTCLVANPYCSPISWTALRNANPAVTNAVYIYNADGSYASFVGGVGTNGGSDALPAGQGFYVVALSNTSLAAKETNKISSNVNLMKMNNEASANVGLPIKLQIAGSAGEVDETAIRFHGSATNAYDVELDAYKIFQTPGYVGYPGSYSKYTTISTQNGNTDYSINSLPYALTQNAVIPVLVKVMTSGQYTISSSDMQLLPPNACVTLKDKLLNVVHNIKASPYVCTINDTTSTARFELTVCADMTTGINDNNPSAITDLSVNVKHNQSGIDVDLNFDKATQAKISVTNILGQKIVENKKVTTQNETVHFGLEPKNQLLFVTVETENNKITKKIIH